jgi:hypothetical protein
LPPAAWQLARAASSACRRQPASGKRGIHTVTAIPAGIAGVTSMGSAAAVTEAASVRAAARVVDRMVFLLFSKAGPAQTLPPGANSAGRNFLI